MDDPIVTMTTRVRPPARIPRARRGRTALVLGAATLLAAACGDEGGDAAAGGDAWAGTVADSAGVQVVSNPAEGLWAAGEAWTVREALSIGSLEGDANQQFGQIIGVDVDDAGSVYVMDMQAAEVRVFGPDGTWLRTIGEPGQGPGQIGQQVGGVFLVGGEVLVPDLQNQRVNRYTPEGESLGSFRIDFMQGIPLRWDGPVNGSLVAQRRRFQPPTDTTTVTAPAGDPVVALDAEGAVTDTLLVVPVGGTIQLSRGGAAFHFFASEPIWDAGPDGRIAMGMNAEFRIEVRDAAGTLQRVVKLPRQPRAVTERDQQVILEAIKEQAIAAGAPPQAVEMMFGQATFADHYPLFASILMGPERSLWVQRIRTGEELTGAAEEATFDPQDLGSTTWDVFDAEGRYQGVVEFPGRFQPLRVSGDRIYGVARDELDVQSMKAFEIVR